MCAYIYASHQYAQGDRDDAHTVSCERRFYTSTQHIYHIGIYVLNIYIHMNTCVLYIYIYVSSIHTLNILTRGNPQNLRKSAIFTYKYMYMYICTFYIYAYIKYE